MGEFIPTFRGLVLPQGMTHDLAERLEGMIIRYVDGAEEFAGVFPSKFAIMLYEAICETRV